MMLLLAAAACFSADVTGKWKAEVQSSNGPIQVTFDFKVEGDKLSGTLTSHMGEIAIKEGKVAGDELTWVLIYEREGNSMKISNKAKVSGDEMQITSMPEGREDRIIQYLAKRSS